MVPRCSQKVRRASLRTEATAALDRRHTRTGPGGIPKWVGCKAQQWSRAVLAKFGTVCHLQFEGCTEVATTGDHLIPRSVRLDLQYDGNNGRPACQH